MAKRMFLNQLNTKDPKACVEFYKKLGFVEDPGFNQKPGAPVNPLPDFAAKMGADDNASDQFTMLRLPDDDYHLEVGVWKQANWPNPRRRPGSTRPGWSASHSWWTTSTRNSPTCGPRASPLRWGPRRCICIGEPPASPSSRTPTEPSWSFWR